jgi:hypothetical protein
MTRSISIAAVALSLSLAAAPAAMALPAGCDDDWGCGMNGTHLTGVRLHGIVSDPAQRQDDGQPVEAEQITVEALTLPTGETVDLR